MKNYKVTVNATVYDVAVEEVQANQPQTQQTISAPTPTPAPAPITSAVTGNKLLAPMQGKVVALKVAVGDTVKKDQVLLLLEAMKMENEIVASTDGVIGQILVKQGDDVKASDILLTITQ